MSDLYRSDETADGLIQRWAGAIRRGKLTGVAVLALEMLKPVGFVASQLLIIADPLLEPLIGHSSRNYARFLENPTNIERLLATLEDRPEPPT